MEIKKASMTKILAVTSTLLIGATGSVAFAMDSISSWNAADGLPGTFWTQSGSVVTPIGSVLTINTLSNSENTYFLESATSNPSFSTTAGLSIEASLSYVSGSTSADARDSVVIAVNQGNNWGNSLYVGNGRMFINSGNNVRGATVAVTTQGFHTYRIDVGASNSDSGSSFNVFYDGELKLSGRTFQDVNANGPEQSVYWGEGSLYAYGKSEWQFVRNVTAVPEPETWALLLAGLGLLGAVARRNKLKMSLQSL